MARRLHKYDRPPYPTIMPAKDRRLRKAYYFIERLTQIDPSFNQKIKQIRHQLHAGKIPIQNANNQTNQAILQAIQREKTRNQ